MVTGLGWVLLLLDLVYGLHYSLGFAGVLFGFCLSAAVEVCVGGFDSWVETLLWLDWGLC